MTALATRAQVLEISHGRSGSVDISGSIVDVAIDDAESEVFTKYGYTRRIKFVVLSSRTQYEFRPTRLETFSVERVFVNSPNINPNNAINRNEVNSGSYTTDLNANTITISSGLAGSYNGSYLEVDFFPIEWHKLVKNKAALNVIDTDMTQMNPGEGDTDNPRVSRIAKRIRRIEGNISPVMAIGSYENIDYDVRDRDSITQRRFNQTA